MLGPLTITGYLNYIFNTSLSLSGYWEITYPQEHSAIHKADSTREHVTVEQLLDDGTNVNTLSQSTGLPPLYDAALK